MHGQLCSVHAVLMMISPLEDGLFRLSIHFISVAARLMLMLISGTLLGSYVTYSANGRRQSQVCDAKTPMLCASVMDMLFVLSMMTAVLSHGHFVSAGWIPSDSSQPICWSS